jgi:predicted RNase H-like nuclease (RuvC/YqgF family)
VRCVCSPLKSTILFPMNPERGTDKLDSELQKQGEEIAKLQENIAENEESEEELKKSLDHLDEVRGKIEGENG